MAFNTLDGTLISPFSNITLARFGGWDIDINLETEGIQNILDYPLETVTFNISPSTDPSESLYSIRFVNGVVTRETNNNGVFTSDPDDFQMDGNYDSTTNRFTFKAHPTAIISSGASFWVDAAFSGIEFPTRHNKTGAVATGNQYPFQYTVDGATNGSRKDEHLLSTPRRITIEVPYFEQGSSTSELFQDGEWKTISSGNSPVLRKRKFLNLRCSQPFLMNQKWTVGDTYILDNLTTQYNFVWGFIESDFLAEHTECDSTGDSVPPTVFDDGDGTVTPTSISSGDGENGIYSATPAVLTDHRILLISQGLGNDGSGTVECKVTGGGGDDGVFKDWDEFTYTSTESPVTQSFNSWNEV